MSKRETGPVWYLVARRELVALALWGAISRLDGMLADGTALETVTTVAALASTIWLAVVLWTAPDRPLWTRLRWNDREDDER